MHCNSWSTVRKEESYSRKSKDYTSKLACITLQYSQTGKKRYRDWGSTNLGSRQQHNLFLHRPAISCQENVLAHSILVLGLKGFYCIAHITVPGQQKNTLSIASEEHVSMSLRMVSKITNKCSLAPPTKQWQFCNTLEMHNFLCMNFIGWHRYCSDETMLRR